MHDKKQIRMKIGKLLDSCEGCQRIAGMSSANLAVFCRENCDTGRQLYELGKLLKTYEEEVRERKKYEPDKISLAEYIDYKRKGIGDREIILDAGIGMCTLQKYKKLWGIPKFDGNRSDRSKYFESLLGAVINARC